MLKRVYMAVSEQECGLKGERKYKGILLIHSNCTRLKKYITQLLKYLVFIRAKTKRPRTWCHDVIKTVINISIVITSFQLESIMTLAEVNYLFTFYNNSNYWVLLFDSILLFHGVTVKTSKMHASTFTFHILLCLPPKCCTKTSPL